jgi:hypothetical protein
VDERSPVSLPREPLLDPEAAAQAPARAAEPVAAAQPLASREEPLREAAAAEIESPREKPTVPEPVRQVSLSRPAAPAPVPVPVLKATAMPGAECPPVQTEMAAPETPAAQTGAAARREAERPPAPRVVTVVPRPSVDMQPSATALAIAHGQRSPEAKRTVQVRIGRIEVRVPAPAPVQTPQATPQAAAPDFETFAPARQYRRKDWS